MSIFPLTVGQAIDQNNLTIVRLFIFNDFASWSAEADELLVY